MKVFPYKNLDSLTVGVGKGEVKTGKIVKFFFGKKIFGKQNTGDKKKSKTRVLIAGKGGYATNIAKCCKPEYGDKIAVYVTKNQGASVHRVDCVNLARVKEKSPEKVIESSWHDA